VVAAVGEVVLGRVVSHAMVWVVVMVAAVVVIRFANSFVLS
jgi:hypothetical protein